MANDPKKCSQMSIEELVDKILGSMNQPPVTYICGLITNGKLKEAVKELIEQEGHWLPKADAKRAVDYWFKEFGPKPIDKDIENFKKLHAKHANATIDHFDKQQLFAMLVHVIKQLPKTEDGYR